MKTLLQHIGLAALGSFLWTQTALAQTPPAAVAAPLAATAPAVATPPPPPAVTPPRPPRLPDYIESNGLKGSLDIHDPVMIKGGDTYYLFGTYTGIKTSKDMVTWKSAGAVFGKGAKLDWWSRDIPQGAQIWAPDIHYRDGKYWMYYSVSAWMNFNSSIGLATNTTLDPANPAYKWEDQGEVISIRNGGEGVNAIDPNAFVDKDGKVYLLYGSFKAGLRMVELDRKTGKPASATPKLTVLTRSLGEGVFLVKDPDYYYIFASRGICCKGADSTYEVVIGRSKTITGPYLSKDGGSWVDDKYSVLLAGDASEPGRGHNGIFAENGTTYFVYHAYTKAFNFHSLLNIKPLYMGADGWPTLEPTKTLFKMDAFETRVFAGP
ncbi:MAG: arabinan endo-1,5-alpha-L-arabinosidase [Massilia sp.]